jgi:hypothetical protein
VKANERDLPPVCAGEHDYHPHAHADAPAYPRFCSGRFWCRACRRWFGGAACETGRTVPGGWRGIDVTTARPGT